MIVFICAVAFFASILTFYSGFGLGTLLSAALFLFFDVKTALFITAIVHLLNNLFKILLVAPKIDWATVIKFGIPSVIGAFIGSLLLKQSLVLPIIHSYDFLARNCTITYVKILMAIVMLFFTFFEINPAFKRIDFDKIGMYLGGLISGFFGGLSGHQGALRSIFLVKANLSKEDFIASGVAIACLVDFTRLPMYLDNNLWAVLNENKGLITSATLAAFVGAFVGSKLIKKVTIATIQAIVSYLIIFIAILLFIGYL
jgi:uncharacterized protein